MNVTMQAPISLSTRPVSTVELILGPSKHMQRVLRIERFGETGISASVRANETRVVFAVTTSNLLRRGFDDFRLIRHRGGTLAALWIGDVCFDVTSSEADQIEEAFMAHGLHVHGPCVQRKEQTS